VLVHKVFITEDEIKLRWKEKERGRNKLATYYKVRIDILHIIQFVAPFKLY
jgi:hypothetical protein